MPEAYEDALNAMAQKFYEAMGPGVQTTSMTAKPDIVAGLRGALRELADRGFQVVKVTADSPGESDPRAWPIAELVVEALTGGQVDYSSPTLRKAVEAWLPKAEDALAQVDKASPDATIRRLQHTVAELMGDDPEEWNLTRAAMIVGEITELSGVQSALKAAFKNDELDGGWKTALEHPLYLQAEARKASLQDELKGLI